MQGLFEGTYERVGGYPCVTFRSPRINSRSFGQRGRHVGGGGGAVLPVYSLLLCRTVATGISTTGVSSVGGGGGGRYDGELSFGGNACSN